MALMPAPGPGNAPPEWDGCPMGAATCRRRAADARQIAETSMDVERRDSFLTVAAQWDRMADQLERLGRP